MVEPTIPARRVERGVYELLGMARGIVADGEVSKAEVLALGQWLADNSDLANVWPINALSGRLERVFEDGRVDDDERAHLAALLGSVLEEDLELVIGPERAMPLPLDDPAPPLSFAGRVYVFAGMFAYGPKSICKREVERRGGSCDAEVSAGTDVLVIGTFTRRNWADSAVADPIAAAAEQRSRGRPIAIVSEDHWAAALED